MPYFKEDVNQLETTTPVDKQGGGLTETMETKPTRPAVENEADNGLKNEVGTVAMAHSLGMNSGAAQFFINVKDNAFTES